MCGVIGLVHQRHREDLGAVASELLRTLEYRGYDSTGAAIQGDGEEVDLRKDVGAPSVLVGRLGIDRLAGRVLCGQVRWATFGAVDKDNAQPHVVRCRTYLYGAHNGNVTNCDALKAWLVENGHQVRSDNDGEMVVHTVEHFFAEKLRTFSDRKAAMRAAIVEAGEKLRGSYAAVIVDPITHTLWAIKMGSSLYFGSGDGDGNPFSMASSDLSAVLKLTHTLLPLSEGEFVEFEPSRFAIYKVKDGDRVVRTTVKSRLRAQDMALRPPFTTFMEQEIHAQIETTQKVVRAFDPSAPADEESAELRKAASAFAERVIAAKRRGGRVFVLSCGSSFHAAKTAALFFGGIADTDVLPLLPGEFRGQIGKNVRDGDLLITVSQSGETKDLIDVVNDVIRTDKDVGRVALVNNLNSTLAQEKSELVIPLRCGPEIAVAATKSFINQMAVFYGLAIELAERLHPSEALNARRRAFAKLPALIEETLESTDRALEEAAELLYLRPSIHLLATRLLGVAKEGALKIREVVLNHTEGFEASEFKHGPNTILGFNTVFGLDQVEQILARKDLPLGQAILEARADYPLVYVTGPDPRDVDLTVSQINTHKIRGASTLIVAEEDPALRVAATKPPADNPRYRSVLVNLPPTGDPLLTAFTATVALQRLALKMSLKKKDRLDRLGVADHGVHPDVPKNVSKSITVD